MAEEPTATEQPGGSGQTKAQDQEDSAAESEEKPAESSEAEKPKQSDAPKADPLSPQRDSVGPMAAGDPPPTLNLNVTIASDGTADFDADSAAGNDSGPNNGVVRVNDTVTYNVNYAVTTNPGDNATFTITFPKGMEILEIPGYCLAAGSSITPATAGSPTLPLHANSIDELSEQTLTCNMGHKDNASDTVKVTAKVLNLARQGEALPLVSATLQTDELGAAGQVTDPTLPTVTASSRLMWDISKNNTVLAENSGPMYGPSDQACPWDTARVCKASYYPISIGAPAGGKGAMPAIGDVTFTDDLTPEAMYPTLNATQLAAINADLDKYGTRAEALMSTYTGLPYQNLSATPGVTEENAVRKSGTTTLVQAGPGQPAQITISGADFTLRTYPSETYTGAALPGDRAYAYAGMVRVYTPVEVIRDFGVESNNTWTLQTRNELTELGIDGFESTDHQTIEDQPGPPSATDPDVNWNDYRTSTPTLLVPGLFSKRFIGLAGAEGNMTPVEFNPTYNVYEGPPGGATMFSGGITVAPTQTVVSMLVVGGSGPSLPADVSVVACDAWDNTKLNLHAGAWPGSTMPTAHAQRIGSGGAPVWISGSNNAVPASGPKADWATSASQVPDLTVQYSATPGGAGSASQCGDAQGPWYDDPADVPGNDAALAAEGIYTGVARVRAHVVVPPPVRNTLADQAGDVRLFISIPLRAAESGDPTGTILPNWASNKRVNFEDLPMGEVIGAPGNWSSSSYNPDAHTGAQGDRLILAQAQVRVDKQVRKGDSGSFSSTPPQVTGGDLVQYRLSPTLTSGAATPGILKDVWVEDCLPGSQTYQSASLTPALVSPGATPADAKRPACAAGETYIRWVINDHEVNTSIDPIILSVDVSPTADDGVYNNTVVVWAEDDASTLEQRRDNAQIQIANIAGVKLEKFSEPPLVQVNRTGQATDEKTNWRVRLTNTLPDDAGPVITNPDVIDVLPKQGEGATAYDGTLVFDAATVTADSEPGTRILYTSAAAVNQDPSDPSNGAAGSTAWCDAPSGGTLVSGAGACPASAAQVTGLRIQGPAGQPYRNGDVLEITLTMIGIGNRAGNVYQNTAFARAQGLEFPVGPVRRNATVVESSIGDRVWWDLNQNGLQDSFQGNAEPGVPNVTVRLTGTDDLGNPVDLTTTTDANGGYLFEGLRSSNQSGYTVTFTAPNGATFTQQHAGDDSDVDSDANASGVAGPVVLPMSTADLSVDAGLIADGSLTLTKLLEGAGIEPFAGGDELVFEIVCTLDGAQVFEDEVTLTVADGATSVTSEEITGLPALAECTITETSAGNADEPAPPVTVTIPFEDGVAGEATASMTNYYSAGTITLSKELDGTQTAVEAAEGKTFEILVTCQVEENGDRVDVFSQNVTFTGSGTRLLEDANGDPVYLPLGARCFADELDDGGASEVSIDHDSYENGVEVTAGTPDELQELAVTVTNTFALPEGGLIISKFLEGAGVEPFAGGDELVFDVVCTFEGGTVFDDTVTLTVAEGATQVVSDELGPIPATSSCTITETSAGSADEPAPPVTVTVPFDEVEWVSGAVTASLTNYYSAGTISLSKELAGDAEAIEKVEDTAFEVLVTCQVLEGDAPATVYSGTVKIKGGQTKMLVDENDEPRALPLGAKCFGDETDTGGATKVSVDHDSFENGVEVTSGTPDELQRLTITAVNTFECTDALCPQQKKPGDPLTVTGAQAGGLAALLAGSLLVGGAILLIIRRRNEHPHSP